MSGAIREASKAILATNAIEEKLFKSTDTGQKACQGLARRSQETFEAPSFQAKRETTKIFTWQRQMPTVLCNRRTLI